MIRSHSSFSSRLASLRAREPWRAALLLTVPLLALMALLAMPSAALARGAGGGGGSVSISPGTGPVGTHITITGAHLTPGTPVQVGFATGDCSSSTVTVIQGATGTVNGDGTITITVTWPQTSTGSFTICVVDTSSGKTHQGDNPFQVLSVMPADITVSNPVTSSQQVTIKGTNFLPGNSSVEVLYGPTGGDGCATSAGTTTVAADGTFTLTFNAPFQSQNTPMVFTAVEPQQSCTQNPVQKVSKNVTVLAASAKVATPTPTASSGGTAGLVWPPTWPPTSAWSVVYCLIGLLLLLLLLLVLLVAARRQRQNQPVTIQERNTVVVPSGRPGTGGGGAAVQREIYAQSPRGRQTRIAEEVTTVEEEPLPPGGGSGR
jgi:hypothetical protein